MSDEKKTKTIGMNMPLSEAESIEASAKSMGISAGMYCKTVIRMFRQSKQKLVLRED